jgi:hypothetical protein
MAMILPQLQLRLLVRFQLQLPVQFRLLSLDPILCLQETTVLVLGMMAVVAHQ